jgi:two-component system nitrate/nitrite response regulator NarL
MDHRMSIRIILADDHPIVLHGLQQLFARHGDFRVLACCPDGSTTADAVAAHRPDVLVLDLRMPGEGGLGVLRTLASSGLDCRAVLLTAAIADEEVLEAVKLGVKGIVLKDSPPDSLLDCVRMVANGHTWFERDMMTSALHSAARRGSTATDTAAMLTRREIEMVRLVGQGLRNKMIAERLSISEGTVKVHLHNIYEKLGVDGRLELVLCAQQKGLV